MRGLSTVILLACACGRFGFQDSPEREPVTLRYAQREVDAVLERTVLALQPTATGTSLAFAISPALPSGLVLEPSTGVISGTPVQIADEVAYTVTASNAAGSAHFELQLTALPGSVVDVVGDEPDDDNGVDAQCYASTVGGCTLRAAFQTANNRTTKQLVLLDARTYALESELGDITNDLVLAGRGASVTAIRPATVYPGYRMITSTTGARLWLRHLGVRHFGRVDGGAVKVSGGGTLTVTACSFTSNRSAGTGGVFYFDAGATATIERSTFTANESLGGCCGGWGGVLHADNAGTRVTVRASTATENIAAWGAFSHISTGSTVTLENSTLYRNVSTTAGTLASPGGRYILLNNTIVHNSSAQNDSAGIFLYSSPAQYTVANTIIAFNRDASGAENNCNRRQTNTSLISQGGNILSNAGGNCAIDFVAQNDRLATDPGIDPSGLADHGGPTPTIMLLPSSAASASGIGCPTVDQRGVARPGAPGSCDVGAVEYSE